MNSRPPLSAPQRLRQAGVSAARDIKNSIQDHPTFFGTFVALYIFLLTSRVLDVTFIGHWHLPLMMLVVLTVALFATGGVGYAYSAKTTKYVTGFTLWVIICYPISTWRGGSTEVTEWQVQALLIYLIIIQLVRTRADWERVTSFYALATLVSALMSFVIGVSIQGRWALPGGSLGDPNEFAMFMVVGLPFWWKMANRSEGMGKLLRFVATFPIYIAFARAGSRSGMLALFVLFAATFFFAQGGKKVVIVVAAAVGMVVAMVALPGYLRARFFTFFANSDSVDATSKNWLSSDVQSSLARRGLLVQSFRLTFKHPVFGVGPGVFNYVGYEIRKAETGNGGLAQVSHNTYTQISSETGFPGFALFFGTVVLCVRTSNRAYQRLKNIDSDYAMSAKYMLFAILALAVGSFFLSIGYTYLLSIMFALATSIHLMVNSYVEARERNGALPSAQTLEKPAWGTMPNLPKRLAPRRPARRLPPPPVGLPTA